MRFVFIKFPFLLLLRRTLMTGRTQDLQPKKPAPRTDTAAARTGVETSDGAKQRGGHGQLVMSCLHVRGRTWLCCVVRLIEHYWLCADSSVTTDNGWGMIKPAHNVSEVGRVQWLLLRWGMNLSDVWCVSSLKYIQSICKPNLVACAL